MRVNKKLIAVVFLIMILPLTASAVTVSHAPENSNAFNDAFDLYENESFPDIEIILNAERLIFSGNKITCSFRVREAGFYALEIRYAALPAETFTETIDLTVALNGAQTPVSLYRIREGGQLLKDMNMNDLPPVTSEYSGWINTFVKSGVYSNPVYFYLEAGRNELVVTGIDETCAFERFTFKNIKKPPRYDEIKPSEAEIQNTPAFETGNEIGSYTIFMQGETPAYKTDANLRATSDPNHYHIVPSSPSLRLYNTLGGENSWSKPRQSAVWEFSIPNDGYYRFSLKVRQNLNEHSSFRRVLLDNAVPCAEFYAVEFKYSKDWYRHDLFDTYIFLEAGAHTLMLEAVCGFEEQVISPLELDYIEIATAHESFKKIENNFSRKLRFGFSRVVNSYFTSYTEISEKSNSDTVNIWVNADRETAFLIHNLSLDFLSGNKRGVAISLVSGSVFEAAIAGKGPDAALFVSNEEINMLNSRSLLSESDEVQGFVLLKNKNNAHAEQAAGEFLAWFYSPEIQAVFTENILAVQGGLGG